MQILARPLTGRRLARLRRAAANRVRILPTEDHAVTAALAEYDYVNRARRLRPGRTRR